MAEQKKRVSWSMVVCGVILVPLGVVFGFIETVGRQGTLLGRHERLIAQHPRTEADVLTTLGTYGHFSSDVKAATLSIAPDDFSLPPRLRFDRWTDGAVDVIIVFSQDNGYQGQWLIDDHRQWPMDDRRALVGRDADAWWHVRRWAEQAYTAIHGPRR